MATANFYNVNATNTFACEIKEEFDYEDLKENLTYEIIEMCKANDISIKVGRGKDVNENNSYCSTVLGTITRTKIYNDFEVSVTLTVIIRSAYYEGCNLDWNVEFGIEGYKCNDMSEFVDRIEYANDCSVAMAYYKASYAKKWAEKTKDKMVELLENIYKQYSTPLKVLGKFSNGEAIYKTV